MNVFWGKAGFVKASPNAKSGGSCCEKFSEIRGSNATNHDYRNFWRKNGTDRL